MFGNFKLSFLGAWVGVLGFRFRVYGLWFLILICKVCVWFSFISFGFIGVVKNIVKKMIYLADWNTKNS